MVGAIWLFVDGLCGNCASGVWCICCRFGILGLLLIFGFVGYSSSSSHVGCVGFVCIGDSGGFQFVVDYFGYGLGICGLR